jgi:predicted dehydrogenase
MRRVRIAIIGAGPTTEWALLPTLLSPDAAAPPDTGAWWSRRPVADSEIRYQPPAQPDVVALVDADEERAARVATAARVAGIYADWRVMLREVQPDAVFCATSPEIFAEVVAAAGAAGVRWLWCDGPPAYSATAALGLAQQLAGRGVHLWCARPLRYAAAHRSGRQVIAREQIGPVTALSLRWSSPFAAAPRTPAMRDTAALWASTYGALDLLLAFAGAVPGALDERRRGPDGAATPLQVLAGERDNAANLWVRFASGSTAMALLASADSWSAPLPRLEVCGTEGRSIVCEAGRRMWLHLPREAARLFEPPGLAMHVTAPNVAGVAEEVKAFLAACVDPALDNTATNDDANLEILTETARVLQLIEATAESLQTGQLVQIDPLVHGHTRRPPTPDTVAAEAPPPATLPLPLH